MSTDWKSLETVSSPIRQLWQKLKVCSSFPKWSAWIRKIKTFCEFVSVIVGEGGFIQTSSSNFSIFGHELMFFPELNANTKRHQNLISTIKKENAPICNGSWRIIPAVLIIAWNKLLLSFLFWKVQWLGKNSQWTLTSQAEVAGPKIRLLLTCRCDRTLGSTTNSQGHPSPNASSRVKTLPKLLLQLLDGGVSQPAVG